MTTNEIVIGERLSVPSTTKALLFDMDGVIVDSLILDYENVDPILAKTFSGVDPVPRSLIRETFALDPEAFWRVILKEMEVDFREEQMNEILSNYRKLRKTSSLTMHKGIKEILADAQKRQLKIAVVSNNKRDDVIRILENLGIYEQFDVVVGNDDPNLAKKPAPDTYLEAARQLSVSPEDCVVIEDSLLGAEAGSSAGCFVVGVAGGTTDYEDLDKSPFVDRCYRDFTERIS